MGTDPEPDYIISLLNSYGPMVLCDTYREYRLRRMYSFKTKTGIIGVLYKLFICFTGFFFYCIR
jgi:hypothetical protein